MKHLLLLIVLLFSTHTYSMEDTIILLNDEGLNIYDMQKLSLIITLEEPQSWRIFNATHKVGITNVLLNKYDKDSEEVLERLIVFDNNTLTLLYMKDKPIQEKTLFNNLDVSIEQLLGPKSDIAVFSSWYGNLYLINMENKSVILRDLFLDNENTYIPYITKYVERKTTCGYFSPVLSSDRELIVCYLERSKHDRKKNIGKNQICEIKVKSKEVKLLPIYGIEPSYSSDANIILFQDIYDKRKINPKRKWKLFYKESGDIKLIPEAYDVAWIK